MMGLSGMHHRRRREACGERGAEFGIAVWRRSRKVSTTKSRRGRQAMREETCCLRENLE